jgi:lysophospholipase L1-like esterase
VNIFSIAVLALLLTGCGSSNYDNWLESPDYLPKKIALDGNKDDCSVIFIGDSRIEGGPFDDQDSGWCNYGIGGDVTWGVENRLSAVIDKQPDTVVIQVGRNDLTVASRDVWTTFLIYRNIIDILVDRGIKVMVTSTLPDSEPSVVTNTMIHELNRLLAEYCEGNAAVFVDLSFALAPDGYLIHTDDGVHSNSVGYVIFIDVVRLRI